MAHLELFLSLHAHVHTHAGHTHMQDFPCGHVLTQHVDVSAQVCTIPQQNYVATARLGLRQKHFKFEHSLGYVERLFFSLPKPNHTNMQPLNQSSKAKRGCACLTGSTLEAEAGGWNLRTLLSVLLCCCCF